MAAITVTQTGPNVPLNAKKVVYATGTSAANGDTMTIAQLTTIQGAIGFCTTAAGSAIIGTPALFTYATNVITIANGGTAGWTFMVWGV